MAPCETHNTEGADRAGFHSWVLLNIPAPNDES